MVSFVIRFSVLIAFLMNVSYLSASDIELTPNSNNGGQLPSGYNKITFKISDGNWVSNIVLPQNPTNNSQVVIPMAAGWSAHVDFGRAQTIDFGRFLLKKGYTYRFVYHSHYRNWRVLGEGVTSRTPKSSGPSIPNNPGRLTYYTLWDGNWTGNVGLPAQANDNDLIVIRSNASWGGRIDPTYLKYRYSTNFQRGDVYVFRYSDGLKKWLIDESPERFIYARDTHGTISHLNSPTTKVYFSNGNWVRNLNLPSNVGDRNKILLSSAAGWSATINGYNINGYSSLRLNKGDEYELMYIAEKGSWTVMDSPVTKYRAAQLSSAGGRIPGLSRPDTVIEFGDGNWIRDVYLPIPSPINYRVTFKTSAAWGFNVRGINNNHSDIANINNGETVAFKVNSQGRWQQETSTVDILLLYSNKVADRIGEGAARARMYQSFNYTNQALENSGAKIRLRMVGLSKINAPAHWITLLQPLQEIRSDPTIQNLRARLKADAIYYEGTEDGCGLGWVSTTDFNMVSTGNLGCSTIVMRHEFGHNLGLAHGKLTNSNGNYALGYSLVRTVMGGNQIPYYSSPNNYTREGIPMGIPNQIDAVRRINDVASQVANFR